MLAYIIGGALIGFIVGTVLPPGNVFWFIIGAVCGYLVKKYYPRWY